MSYYIKTSQGETLIFRGSNYNFKENRLGYRINSLPEI